MAVTLTASLVPSSDPRPVQLVLAGTTSGQEYAVTGTALGSSWAVPGGVGVSTGGQVILTDNRSALNVPVVYSAVVAGVTYAAASVTVTGPDFVLQSMDGQSTAVPLLLDGDFPVEPIRRHTVYDVPGRDRPPVRFASAGHGGGVFNLLTDPPQTQALLGLFRSGRPLVYRSSTAIRDLPAVGIILPTASPSVSLPDLSRRWSLSYLLVDDPEPSAVLSAWTADDFDAAMASRTWADFDALFAAETGDTFDVYPWGQLI